MAFPSRWLAKYWFLLALVVCFAVGHGFSQSLEPVAKWPPLRNGLVFAVMWAMGVTLKPDAVRRSVTRPLPCLLAIGTNVFLVPLLCLPFWWLLSPVEFGGLFVAALVPCTLASASVWTRKAGGDDSIAIMTTLVTNVACVLVVPLGVALVLAKQVTISPLDQMIKLALLVVLPLIVAQMMRRWVGRWADRNKLAISSAAQLGILMMVMIGAVSSAEYLGHTTGVSWWSQLPMLLVASGVHLAALASGVFVSRRLGLPAEQQIAVGISGSQKTLMVGLQVAIDCGVSVLPMLIFHLAQLVLDTIIASRWSAKHGVGVSTD
ncbi:bile acid:sodium symporter family protein [Stieleria varia]|uniref:Sodium Bile acid symporter family protein n=1 Tax=Stieleria varia TaxID=2528005 RepID=A0A5C6AHB3_9BACT|nr:bile acid:sodium symporter [Stieleria varia]TWT98688.1 Sodium Bile acid symporter family protein [Stieleria varia]